MKIKVPENKFCPIFASHPAHTVFLSHGECDNDPIPASHRWFMGAYKRSYILHNMLHNESVGILPVCSGWEQWSVCWSENKRVRRLKQQETAATHKPAREKRNCCTRTIDDKLNPPLFKWTRRNGGRKINRRDAELFFQVRVNNMEQIFKWFIKKKNHFTVAKVGFSCRREVLYNWWWIYCTAEVKPAGGELPDDCTITCWVMIHKRS